MKIMISKAVCVFGVMVLSAGSAQADLCDSQVDVLLKRASSEVTPALNTQQLEQLENISMSLCQSRTAAQGDVAVPPPGFDDWFSYFMMNKQADKPGNKRLKRLKR